MVAQTCVTDFKETLKGIFSEDEATALTELVKERAEARRIKKLEPRAEALGKSVEDLINRIEAENTLKQKEYKLNALKRRKDDEFMEGFKDDYSKGLFAKMYGIESNIPKSRLSISNAMHSRANDVHSHLNMGLAKEGVSKIFNNKNYDALNALARAGVKVDDPNAMKVGKAVKDAFTYARKLANLHGAGMTEEDMDGYVARTTHNVEKMKSPTGSSLGDYYKRLSLYIKHKGDFQKVRDEMSELAYKRWHNTIRPLTDDERTLDHVAPDKEEDFFKSFYNATTNGIRKVPYTDEGSPLLTGLRRSANIAEKLRAERVWHPKDPRAWLEYNKKYGFGSFHDAAVTQLERMGKSIGLMETTGTNPRAYMTSFIQKYERLARDQKKVGSANRIWHAKGFVDFALGDFTQPMQGLFGKMLTNLRLLAYSHLGAITIHSLGDMNTIASALNKYGYSYLDVLSTNIKNFAKGLGDPERKELAMQLGLYSDGTFMNLLSRWGSIDSPKGLFAKGLWFQERYSLINRYDNIGRYTGGSMIAHKFAFDLDKKFTELTEPIRTNFLRYGIDERIWKLLQDNKGQLFKTEYGKYLTPYIANRISDASIATKYLGNKLPRASEGRIFRARQEIYSRLLQFFQDQSLYGKTLPTIADRALLNLRAKQGTIPGAIWKTLTMFRTFDLSATRRTLGRFMYSGGAENIYDALVRGKADFKGLAKFMVGSIPLGYASLSASRLLLGEAPPDPRDIKTWLLSMFAGGGGFLYAAILDQYLEKRSTLIKALGGRGLDLMEQMSDLLSGKVKSAEAFTKLIHRSLPFGNLFWIKPILDRAIFDEIYKKIDPMYKYKLKKRLAKENIHMLHLP